MKPSDAITESLKQALRARGISYRQLAQQLGCAEVSVKRMFAKRNFDLGRLDQILQALDEDLESLLAESARRAPELDSLEFEQELRIVQDQALFIVAICALHHLQLGEMTTIYRITAAEAIRCLLALDKMGFLTLRPDNTYRLRVSPSFRWLADGPIVRFFRGQAPDFLDAAFDGPGETLSVLNVRLGNEARLRLLRSIATLVREYTHAHASDSSLPLGKRHPMSLIVATRSWEPGFMKAMRRIDDSRLAAWLKETENKPAKAAPLRKRRASPKAISGDGSATREDSHKTPQDSRYRLG